MVVSIGLMQVLTKNTHPMRSGGLISDSLLNTIQQNKKFCLDKKKYGDTWHQNTIHPQHKCKNKEYDTILKIYMKILGLY